MTFKDLVDRLKVSIGFSAVHVYYNVPGKELTTGLREINCDDDLKIFTKHCMNNGGQIQVYY